MDKKFSFSEKLNLMISFTTLASIIFAGCFWFFKTNELPKTVASHENRITNIERQIAENNTKTELIYQSVLEIRRVLMYK